MLTPPLKLTCFEYRRRLEGGVTRPLLMAAADETGKEHQVVLKVRRPDVRDGHFEGTSLACELICSILARAIGLAVPDYAIVEVPAVLLQYPQAVPDEKVRQLLKANIGPNFGSSYQEAAFSWSPSSAAQITTELIGFLADVLTFDAAVLNGDRTGAKPNLLWNGKQPLLIDHSYALPIHTADEATLVSSPLFPESHVRAHCAFNTLSGRGSEFKSLIEMWQALISDGDLRQLRALIPSTWEKRVGDLDKIFRFLSARPTRFADIQTDLKRIVQ